jgi:hypothetical protein
MEIDAAKLEVTNNPDAERFEAVLGESLGIIEYNRRPGVYVFTHTEVPREYSGRGIADRMAYVALETAIAEEQKIVPECPFVKKYLQRHPEYEWLIVTLAEGD